MGEKQSWNKPQDKGWQFLPALQLPPGETWPRGAWGSLCGVWGFLWPEGMLTLLEDQSRGPSFWGSFPRVESSLPPFLPHTFSSILSFGQTKQMLTEEKKRKRGCEERL